MRVIKEQLNKITQRKGQENANSYSRDLEEQKLLQRYHQSSKMKHLKWAQRARDDTLEWGDFNTKFLHNMVVKRRQRNRISSIRNEEGQMVKDTHGIGKVMHDYF